MSTFDGQTFYYSGQGVVMIGERNALGVAKGFIPVGNVSDLKIDIAATVLEHKESQSGVRGIDLRLQTELKATLSMTIENFNRQNLAYALRADITAGAGASVTGQAFTGYLGKVQGTNRISLSSVVLKRGVTTLTPYVNDSTAYDYKVNLDNGSIQLNNGSVALLGTITTGGTAPTVIAVGSPTVITVANTAAVGDYVVFSGFTGADAALINKIAFKITVASAASVSIDLDTTGKTITLGTPLSFFDGGALLADFTYAAQNRIDALTLGQVQRALRFEGLNTADGNLPVLVEVFKFDTDPLKELTLISDTIGQMVLTGNVLSDPLQSTGSKYFRATLLR